MATTRACQYSVSGMVQYFHSTKIEGEYVYQLNTKEPSLRC